VRVLLQRCSRAEVRVDGAIRGAVGQGLVALVGTTHGDGAEGARALARWTADLRVFADAAGKTNLSVRDVGGAVLVVSQFTLYADVRKGTRPSFTAAGPPDAARALVDTYRAELEALGIRTAAGVFGARMELALVNDGPFTVLLDRPPGPRPPPP